MFKFFRRNKKKKVADIFHHIYYRTDRWKGKETGSGPGSTLENTKRIREKIPGLLHSVNATSLLDAPCGDMNWMSHIQLGTIKYTGADIIEKLIKQNRKKFPGKEFIVADICTDDLPYADVVLCRDCFIHLPNELILAAISNFKKAGIKFMLTNTYDFITVNSDVETGEFRMINLRLPPFSLASPVALIEEEYTSGYPDKKLGLWKL